MQDEVAIKVEHVSKDFILPHEKVTSVKGLFTCNVALGMGAQRQATSAERNAAILVDSSLCRGCFNADYKVCERACHVNWVRANPESSVH